MLPVYKHGWVFSPVLMLNTLLPVVIVMLCGLWVPSHGQSAQQDRLCLPESSSSPDTHYFKTDASVVIGAMFSLFQRPEEEVEADVSAEKLAFADVSDAALARACREFRLNRLIDHSLAFTHIISNVHNGTIRSKVSNHSMDIGYTIADSCRSLFVNSRMALRFGSETPLAGRKSFCAVRSELLPICSNFSGSSPSPAADNSDVGSVGCPENTSMPVRNMAIAVGLTESKVVLPVSTIFSTERLTHISPAATGNGFVNHSNGQLPYFFRTVPPDEMQAQALIDIAKFFKWDYIIALASSNDNYGTPGLIKLQDAAHKANVCIAYSTTFSADDHQIDSVLSEIVAHLRAYPEAKAVILFAGTAEARLLFEAIIKARRNLTDPTELDKVWLGSDYWGNSASLRKNQNLTEAIPTAIILTPRLPRTFDQFMDNLESNYRQHLLSLSIDAVRRHTSNPWLCRYWEEEFQCNNACPAGYAGRRNYSSPCRAGDRLTEERLEERVPSFGWARNIIAATELSVRALEILLDKASPSATAKEAREYILNLANSDAMREAVRRVMFPCSTDMCQLISQHSEPTAAFSISNFASRNDSLPSIVGYWEVAMSRNILELNTSSIRWTKSIPSTIASTCHIQCRADQGRKNDPDRPCCTKCINCTEEEYRRELGNGDAECGSCENGERSNANRTGCEALPRTYLNWDDPIGIVLVAVVSLCIALVIGTLIIFHRYRESPVAKASDRHLMNLILVGMLFGYAVALLQIGEPGRTHCTIAKLAQSPPFIFTTATLLIKTSRLARMAIAAQKMSKLSRKWTLSISAQVMFIIVVAVVGITLDLVLTLTKMPDRDEQYNDREEVFVLCKYEAARSAVLDFYVIILILVTSVFAFVTRKMPMNFNEARHIFLTSFCLCAVWGMLAPPIYFSGTRYVAVLYALRLVTHMAAIWLFLFTPRLYIFLFRKHRNSVYADVPGSRSSSRRRRRSSPQLSVTPSQISNGMRIAPVQTQ